MSQLKLGDLQQMMRSYKDAATELDLDKERLTWLANSNFKFLPACEFICPSCKAVIQTNISYLVDTTDNRIERAFRGSMEIGFIGDGVQFYAHPHVYNYRSICMGYDANGNPNNDLAAALFVGLNPGSALVDVGRWLRDVAGHECNGFDSIQRDIERISELRAGNKSNLRHQESVNQLFELAEDQSSSAVQLGTWMRTKFNPTIPEFHQKYQELESYGVELLSVGRVMYLNVDTIMLYYPGRGRSYMRGRSSQEIVKLKEGAVIPRRPRTIFMAGDKVRLKEEYHNPLTNLNFRWPMGISRTETYEVLGYETSTIIRMYVPAWNTSRRLQVHPNEIEIVKEEENE